MLLLGIRYLLRWLGCSGAGSMEEEEIVGRKSCQLSRKERVVSSSQPKNYG